jgi:hypothetical protein
MAAVATDGNTLCMVTIAVFAALEGTNKMSPSASA